MLEESVSLMNSGRGGHLRFSSAAGALFALLLPASAAATISATHLTGGATNLGNTLTTAPISPGANELVLAWVLSRDNAGPITPTLSGNGLTWVQVGTTVSYGSISNPSRHLSLFRAMGASPTAGSMTIKFSRDQIECAWSIQEFSGVDTSGTNGSGAINQVATNRRDFGPLGFAVTLPSSITPGNATAGGFGNTVGPPSITAGSGYTAFPEAGQSNVSLRSEWRAAGSTTVNCQSADGETGGIAIEISQPRPGIQVSPTSGLMTTEAGGTATFTVVLKSQPTADVTIGLSSSDVSEGTVSPSSLMFTAANWSTPQTVTVTGANDAVVDGNVAYTIVTAPASSTDPGYNGLNPADVAVTNSDNDVAGFTVNPTTGLVTTEAGGTATFTVVLTSQPTANVTFGVTSSDPTEGTASPGSLTFTATNWSVPQTVTVTGVNDAVDDGTIAYTIVTGAATSSDPVYNGMNPQDVSATNNDDDSAGIIVAPTSGLVTTETGDTATFTVALTSQPTANVTIGLSSSDPTEGTVLPGSLTFTSANWSTPQTVTVTGVNDAMDDGDIAYTIVTGAAISVDPLYNGRDPADVSVTNNDDDSAGVTVAPTSGLVTTEAGGTATFTVALTSQPSADVTVGVSSSNPAEGTVSAISLTFTSADWATPQTVTVTGVDDAIADGDVVYSIQTAAAVSADPTYSGIDAADPVVTNIDNETPGIAVAPTAGLVTTEAGGTATFSVVLNSQPTADVTIGISSSDPTEGTVSPGSVTFNNVNWATPQIVTVTGVDDEVDDGNILFTIITAAASSSDSVYNGMKAADVSTTNIDDDAAGIAVTPTVGLATTEAGATATFAVALTSQPTADVTIALSSSNVNEGTVVPSSVTFTAADWNLAQTVTVTGVNDEVDDGDVDYTVITAPAASADSVYNGIDAPDVSVTNTDDDTAGIIVTPTSGLTTTEAGGTATFTVVLASQPTADVTIGLGTSNAAEGTPAPGSLVFTSANWNTPQTVTVSGVDDLVDDGDIPYTIITDAAASADPIYNGIDPADVSVTNTDNDSAGVTVSPAAGLVTTEAGGTATFTIVLRTMPTSDVTFSLSSSNPGEGTVDLVSVTFGTADWNVPRTVTVTGVDDAVDDGDVVYSILTGAGVSADPVYASFDPADVSVTNVDDDAAGITVAPTAGLTTTEAGGSATFTVVLQSQPTADVTIGLSSSDLTEGSAAPGSLTFTASNWDAPQTVTATGVDDAIDDGDVAYSIVTAPATSADPNYNGRDAADVAVTNTDDDVAGITVTPTAGLVTTEAGGTASFTVVLDTQPTADVTLALSSSDLTEGTVAPASLTFTAADWNTARTVTVTGVDDAIDDGDITYSVLTAPATSADPNYNGRNAADVSVTNTDNDVAGITVSPTAGLVTTEAGGTATFTVALDTQPIADVTIGLSSSDATEGSVAPASLTFTAADWMVAQAVTVTGVDDSIDDGDIAYSIVTAPAASADTNYSGRNAADVSVINTDNDAAGITVAPTAGLVTTEAGGTATFTVVLDTQPTADVTIGLSSSDPTEGSVAPASVTFTPANWIIPQTVTVTGVDDAIDDGDIAYTVLTGPATSADPNFSGRNAADVSVTNADNDSAGITVAPTAGLVTTEGGGTATFTVVLDTQPIADVTIGLSSSDATEGTVAPASLTFTATNWNVARTVTVTGVDDAIDDGDIAYSIVTAPAVSADPNYNGRNAADLAVTNTDDDAAAILVAPTTGLVTTEAGGTATFTVVLGTQPTANVTIGLSSSDATEGTVGPASLTFTAANWNVAQTVTVTGVDDAIDDGDVAYSIVTAPAVSADTSYSGRNAADVAVTNTDDDAAAILVAPTASLVTTEAGGAATFTVVLQTQPIANVTIGLSSSDATEGTVAPASLTFTATNWNVAQTVTATGVDDAVDDGDVVYSIITAPAASADTTYNGRDASDVTVTNTDNDTAGITVTPTAGLVTTEAGGSATFTVSLQTQPVANVTIGLSSSDPTEGLVAPASLTFTAANWNVAQTVTVTGVDDPLDDGDVAYTILTAPASSADANYNGRDASDVTVTNTDNDTAGITVTPTAGLVTTEAGGTATFTVVLDTQPTANVTVGLSSSDLTEGTVAPASLTFTAGNWNVAQTATVTGVDDLLRDGDIPYTVVTAAAVSGDPGYAGLDPSDVGCLNLNDDLPADSLRSTVTAVPALVLADGAASSILTATLRDRNGVPVAGYVVSFTSDRGAFDSIVQPASPTDASGVATGAIRSTTPGVSTITAAVPSAGMTVASHPTVSFTNGTSLRLAKSADRDRVSIGQPLTYTVTLASVATRPLPSVFVEDTPPAPFKYVRGSASLDGAPLGDPVPGSTLAFDIGTVPALVDGNGNGVADPGEPGFMTLRYQVLVGSGATSGSYANLAYARDACVACAISNTAQARVDVVNEPVLSLGTVLGRVFEDADRDGLQGREEAGVAGARIALDDGMVAITDREGFYHFPAVNPGHRLIKIDLHSLPGIAQATGSESRFLTVTSGMLTKANFGVVFDRDTVKVGSPGTPGFQIAAESPVDTIDVRGNINDGSVVVNGRVLALREGDARLNRTGLQERVTLTDGMLVKPIEFHVNVTQVDSVSRWVLNVFDDEGHPVHRTGADGRPPETITWDGHTDSDSLIEGGAVYRYQLTLFGARRSRLTSAMRAFAVERRDAVAVTLAGDAFDSGAAALGPGTRDALETIVVWLGKHPRDKIVVEGHTDSIGTAAANRALSLRRAQAAADYLTKERGIAPGRLDVTGYGEERPIASNATLEGRRMNRRIELRGRTAETREVRVRDYDEFSPAVVVNDSLLASDEDGRFVRRLGGDVTPSVSVSITDRHGRESEEHTPLPALEILSPTGTVRLKPGGARSGYRVRMATGAATPGPLIAGEQGGGREIVAECQLVGRTSPANSVEIDGVRIDVGSDSLFTTTLPLQDGLNAFGIVVRNPEGLARLVTLPVQVSGFEPDGQRLIRIDPVPNLRVAVPPRGRTLTGDSFSISGVTDPGNRVTVNGDTVDVAPDGSFTGIAKLHPGKDTLVVEATDSLGRVARVERETSVNPNRMFLVALAEGAAGRLEGSGLLRDQVRNGDRSLYTEGRVAYYLKGVVRGRYLLTSAYDSGLEEFAPFFDVVDRSASDRLLTNLDPNRYYPVYGDSSVQEFDTERHGRFYLAVQSDELAATVGASKLSLTGGELAGFERTVDGTQVRYQSLSRTRFGDPQTQVALIGANARYAHVRDELRGTGGSLYYLSHKEVAEGGEEVSLAIHDRQTGLVRVRIPQHPGVDYIISYFEGRLLFTRPVSSVSAAGTIASQDPLAGDPVVVEVEYEVRNDADARTLTGGRARQQLGDHVAVGGVLVRDDLRAAPYELKAVDGELRLSADSRITGEVANSSGNGASAHYSEDGGLSFVERTPATAQDGGAWRAAFDLDAGEWFQHRGVMRLRGYLKDVDRDFVSSGNLDDRGTRKSGLGAELGLGNAGTVTVRFDSERRPDSVAAGADAGSGSFLAAQWRRDRERWGFGLEAQSRSVEDRSGAKLDSSSVVAGRLWTRLANPLVARLDQQLSLRGTRDDRTTLGLQYRVNSRLGLEAEGTTGSLGNSAQGRATLGFGAGSIYVAERYGDEALGTRTSTVIGTQAPIGSSSRVYSEYQWQRFAGERQNQVLVGAQHQIHPAPSLSIVFGGEHSAAESGSSPLRHTTVTGDVRLETPSGVRLETRNEVRFDRPGDRVQLLTSNQAELRLVAGLSVLGRWRWSETRDREHDRVEAHLEEHGFGLALRPVHGGPDVLARYTRTGDVRPVPGTGSAPASHLDVLSLEGTTAVGGRMEWTTKSASLINTDGNASAGALRTHSVLLVNRLNAAIRSPFGMGLEYRVLSQREAADSRTGWLYELTWDVAPHVRVGAGFNFADFSDNEFSHNDSSVRGTFLRLQGRY